MACLRPAFQGGAFICGSAIKSAPAITTVCTILTEKRSKRSFCQQCREWMPNGSVPDHVRGHLDGKKEV